MRKIFIDNYLLLNLKNFLDPSFDFPINLFLLSIAAGTCIASVMITCHRRYISLLVKRLMRHRAQSEDTAKTLSELKIKPGILMRSAIRKQSGQLAKLILRVDAKQYTYEEYVTLQKKKGFREEKINLDDAKFYINPEALDRAKRINEDQFPSYVKSALACVLIILIFGCITLFMPEILTLIAKWFF